MVLAATLLNTRGFTHVQFRALSTDMAHEHEQQKIKENF